MTNSKRSIEDLAGRTVRVNNGSRNSALHGVVQSTYGPDGVVDYLDVLLPTGRVLADLGTDEVEVI